MEKKFYVFNYREVGYAWIFTRRYKKEYDISYLIIHLSHFGFEMKKEWDVGERLTKKELPEVK